MRNNRRSLLRTTAVSALVGSVLLIPATAALAAGSGPEPQPLPAQQAGVKPAAATLTVKASVSHVRAWQEFRITGKATGLKAGSKVTLQQKQRGAWKALPASTVTNTSGSYGLRVKLGIKGKNELRIASGATVSPVVAVTVN
ncbi:hypothetical protein [Streptomyces sp. BA2]|uniref:hypothetical protein n=1 Tax=Streptomyces sp. BA2 TaxID=436595 RepID=UPI001320F728|nr:hypothetical protein [Streptomyces sp. BA2]MWA08584.1 hypothetical protein [Streptomyces sp. BA2]